MNDCERERIRFRNFPEAHASRQAMDNLCRAFPPVIPGVIMLRDFFPLYEKIMPLVHKHCIDERTLDIDALILALSRLPKEVLFAHYLYLQKRREEPMADGTIPGLKRIRSRGRRRMMFSQGEGRVKFITLDGETDILDSLTLVMLCIKELIKIRNIVNHEDFKESDREKIRVFAKTADDFEEKSELIAFLAGKFNVQVKDLIRLDKELEGGLLSLIVKAVETDPGEISIEFAEEFFETEDNEKTQAWVDHLAMRLSAYVGRPIMFVSSELISLVGCLSGFAMSVKEEIIEKGRTVPGFENLDYDSPAILNFVLSSRLIKTDLDLLRRKEEYEKEYGIFFVRDSSNSEVDVQIIDPLKLDFALIDKRIKLSDIESLRANSPIIVNINYPLGSQAHRLMGEMLETFGDRIQSISIIGKAGVIDGERFDIIIPGSILPLFPEDGAYDLENCNGLTPDDFKGLIDCKINTGFPMLTVPGIIFLNKYILDYYIRRFRIVGVEMEAYPYLCAFVRALVARIVSKNVKLNLGYWASDKPLRPKEMLSSADHMLLGADSAYVLALAIANKVLNFF